MEKKPKPYKSLKEKAIDILKTRGVDFQTENEAMKMLHELSVHQIELELQNEELTRAKETATELAEKYTELYDFAPAGYLTLSEQGKIIEMNLAAARMMGRERNRLINASFEYFLSPGSKTVFRNFFRDIYTRQVSQSCDVTFQDGNHFHLQGNIVNNRWILTAMDITAIKKAEREREDLLVELREAREKLDIAMEKTGIGSWELDLSENRIILDDRLMKLFRLGSVSELSFDDFEKIIHKDDLPHVRKEISDSVKNKVPVDTVFRFINDENEIKYMNFKGFVRYNKNYQRTLMTGLCFDITRIYESTEKSIIRLNEKLIKSNTELENFAYVASHDLQEPLRMVASFTQLLEKQYGEKLDDTAREYIKYAVDGAKRMYDLLNSLLTYSRVQTRAGEFQRIDLNDVVEKVKDNLHFLIKERGVVINSEKLPVVVADHNQMIQLIQNLVENGVKFSNKEPLISISSDCRDGYHIITVSDRGIGIDKIYFDRIFRIFQRLHPNHAYAGTGIGLSVCRSIVERHGGTIWLDSEPGKGSSFHFSIPVRTEENG